MLDGHEKSLLIKLALLLRRKLKNTIEAARKAPDFKASLRGDVRFMKTLKKGKLGS